MSKDSDTCDYFLHIATHMVPFSLTQDSNHKLIDLMFSKKKADNHKEWLQQFRMHACPHNLLCCCGHACQSADKSISEGPPSTCLNHDMDEITRLSRFQGHSHDTCHANPLLSHLLLSCCLGALNMPT